MALFIAVLPTLHAQENRAALDAFVKQLKEHDAAIEALAEKNAGVTGGGLLLFRNAAAGVQAIKTDGLPANLKDAFQEYAERCQAMADTFKEWPAKAEDVEAFIKRKTAENPNFMADGQKKAATTMASLGEAIDKVTAVGKKYGLELKSLLQ